MRRFAAIRCASIFLVLPKVLTEACVSVSQVKKQHVPPHVVPQSVVDFLLCDVTLAIRVGAIESLLNELLHDRILHELVLVLQVDASVVLSIVNSPLERTAFLVRYAMARHFDVAFAL